MKLALGLGIGAVCACIAGIFVVVSGVPGPWSQVAPFLILFLYPVLLACATAAHASLWRPRYTLIHWIVAGLLTLTFARLALSTATGNMRLDPPDFEHPLSELSTQLAAWTVLALPLAAALSAVALCREARFSGDRTIVITIASAVLVWPIAAFTYPVALLVWPLVIIPLAGLGVARDRREVRAGEVSTSSTTGAL